MCVFISDNDEFDHLLSGTNIRVLNWTTGNDSGETATSSVSLITGRQVPRTLVVADASYVVLKAGWGSHQEPTHVNIHGLLMKTNVY